MTASATKTNPLFPSIYKLMGDALWMTGNSLYAVYFLLLLFFILAQLSPANAEGVVSAWAWLCFTAVVAGWFLAAFTCILVLAYRFCLRWFFFHPHLQLHPQGWHTACLALHQRLLAAWPVQKVSKAVRSGGPDVFEKKVPQPATWPMEESFDESTSLEAFKKSLAQDAGNPFRGFKYILPGLGRFFVPLLFGHAVQLAAMALIFGGVFLWLWLSLGSPSLEQLALWFSPAFMLMAKTSAVAPAPEKVLQAFQQASGGVIALPELKRMLLGFALASALVSAFQTLTLLWVPFVVIWRLPVLKAYKLALLQWKEDPKGLFALAAWTGTLYLLLQLLVGLTSQGFFALLLETVWMLLSSLLLLLYVFSRLGCPEAAVWVKSLPEPKEEPVASLSTPSQA
jgi:hypothetical protein